jgi:hypothetical protein
MKQERNICGKDSAASKPENYFKFHLEGALTSQGKTWEDAWVEFAPESLKRFPLPAGSL